MKWDVITIEIIETDELIIRINTHYIYSKIGKKSKRRKRKFMLLYVSEF